LTFEISQNHKNPINDGYIVGNLFNTFVLGDFYAQKCLLEYRFFCSFNARFLNNYYSSRKCIVVLKSERIILNSESNHLSSA